MLMLKTHIKPIYIYRDQLVFLLGFLSFGALWGGIVQIVCTERKYGICLFSKDTIL
jgi:hypothetical protein